MATRFWFLLSKPKESAHNLNNDLKEIYNWTFQWKMSGTVMQIEKVLINDCLRVSKVPWKFRIPTIYNVGVI